MLKELKTHHRNILQMSFNGFRPEQIAERFEMSIKTVYHILSDPLAKSYLNGLSDKMKESTLDVRKELISMNRDALNAFKRLLDPKQKAPAAVQATIARDILDRTGHKASDKLNIDMTFHGKTDAEIDAEIAAIENSISKIQTTSSSTDDKLNNEDDSSKDSLSEEFPDDNALIPPIEEEVPDKESQEILDNSNFDPFHNIEGSNNE